MIADFKPYAHCKDADQEILATPSQELAFAEVVSLIHAARQRTYQAINTELVGLYWQVGGYISSKLAAAEWGEGVVKVRFLIMTHQAAATFPSGHARSGSGYAFSL